MVELWERFSYYGMRALLVLYLTGRAVTGGFDIDEGRRPTASTPPTGRWST